MKPKQILLFITKFKNLNRARVDPKKNQEDRFCCLSKTKYGKESSTLSEETDVKFTLK